MGYAGAGTVEPDDQGMPECRGPSRGAIPRQRRPEAPQPSGNAPGVRA